MSLVEFAYQTYIVVLPIVLGYIVWLLKQSESKRSANSTGMMLLLRIKLIEYHDEYVSKGYIPSYVYENFCDLYKAYHALGGNGLGDKMMKEIEDLEIKKEGEIYGKEKGNKMGKVCRNQSN